MTAKECIVGRRSIRQFTEQTVPHELLAQIVEDAKRECFQKTTGNTGTCYGEREF